MHFNFMISLSRITTTITTTTQHDEFSSNINCCPDWGGGERRWGGTEGELAQLHQQGIYSWHSFLNFFLSFKYFDVVKIKWRLQKVSLHCTTLLCRKNLHMPKLRVVWGRGIWTRCFWNPSIAKCAHKSISPFCLMYHWSHQCSLCWSEARQHCHHSNIASHNWDCLGCRARWWPMMGSPQDNLWRRSLNSLHITALYLWSDLWGLPPRCPLEEVVKAGAQGLQPLQPPEDQVLFSSHGTSYHVDSPAMFFVDSC